MSEQISPIIGKQLLSNLMLNLYVNPQCIYREYIQNAYDAINMAVNCGVLNNVNEGIVSISILEDKIVIEDNGTGIPYSRAASILTDIANGTKDGVNQAGQYGIGRLAGGGYCRTLSFKTSAKDEDKGTIVTINIDKLRSILEDVNDKRSAETIMAEISNAEYYDELEEKHYFKVELNEIVRSSNILLDEKSITTYIKSVAPLDYGTIFSQIIKNAPQEEYSRRHRDDIKYVRLSVNDNTDIEKGYKKRIGSDEIDKIRYFDIADERFGNMAWGWYAVTEFSVQIPEKDRNRGIRLRKHNISLEPTILNEFFKESRGNSYFAGEIFITHNRIIPNSSRDGLAAGEESDAFKTALRKYFWEHLHLVYTRANKLKNLLKDVEEYIKKYGESTTTKEIVAHKLFEVCTEFERITSTNSVDEVKDVADIYKRRYDRLYAAKLLSIKRELESPSIPEPPKPEPPKPEPPKPEPPKPEPPKPEPPKPEPPKPEPPKPEPPKPEPPKPEPPKPEPPKPEPPKPEPPKGGMSKNPIQVLRESGKFSDEQINLLTRVFGTMNMVCDRPFQTKLKELQMVAVNQLIKF